MLDALNVITPPDGNAIDALIPKASIVPPAAGYILTEFAPLFTITILRPVVAVGSVTPDGFEDAVVITL